MKGIFMNLKNLLMLSFSLIFVGNIDVQAAVEPLPARQETTVTEDLLKEINVFIQETKSNYMWIKIECFDGNLQIKYDGICKEKIDNILESLSRKSWLGTLKSFELSNVKFDIDNLKNVLSKTHNLQELSFDYIKTIRTEVSQDESEDALDTNEFDDMLKFLSEQPWIAALKSFKLSGPSFGLGNLNNVLSKTSNLQKLSLSIPYQDYEELKHLGDLKKTLHSLHKLQVLELEDGSFSRSNFDFAALVPSGRDTPELRELYLGGVIPNTFNSIGYDLKIWNAALSQFPNLEVLDLNSNDLGNGLTTLLPAIKGMHKLKRLNLGSNELNSLNKTGLKSFAAALSSLPELEELDLYDNELQYKLITLMSAIKETHNLKRLHLEGNEIASINKNALQHFASKLSSFSELEELDLRYNELGRGLMTLLPAIEGMTKLQKLNLSYNDLRQLSKNDLNALNKALLSLPNLNGVNLDSYGLECEDLLPRILQSRNSHTLNLAAEELGSLSEEELQILNESMLLVRDLDVLVLIYNNLGNKLTVLLPAIKEMRDLKALYLDGNKLEELDENGLTALNDALSSLSNLEKLALSNNKLGNRLETLLPAINKMRNLKNLKLSKGNLTKSDCKKLEEAIIAQNPNVKITFF